ncbi:MAG: hypothetical protein ACOYMF_16020 [Bacteroidales bacterium]
MDKQDYHNLLRKGIIVLRAQYDGKKNCHKIAEYTHSGGWRHFGRYWYNTKEECLAAISLIVTRHPEMYKADE